MKIYAMRVFSIFFLCFAIQNLEAQEISLFNGKDLEGWIPKIYHHETGDNFANTFRVKDGILQIRYDEYKDFGDRFGHLFYETPFSSFHLKFEYRFTGIWRPDAPVYTKLNSGIMFHSQSPESILKEQNWPISVEMQLLAEEKVGVPRPTGNMCSPGTDVVFEGKIDPRHCINSSSRTYKNDEWVKAELIVHADSLIQHVINGEVVLEYSQPTIGGGVAEGYDPAIWQPGLSLKSGYIGLQSEGQEIDFRNIRIIKL